MLATTARKPVKHFESALPLALRPYPQTVKSSELKNYESLNGYSHALAILKIFHTVLAGT
jgi:hypothetical protein